MADYKPVSDALERGDDPSLLCTTCPWDRNCVNPPTMTKAEVDARMEEAKEKDEADADAKKARGEEVGMPTGTLITLLAFAGADTRLQVCPVFAMRLRSGSGGELASAIRSRMQAWDDDAVTPVPVCRPGAAPGTETEGGQ